MPTDPSPTIAGCEPIAIDRVGGLCLIAAPLAMVCLMALHPSVHSHEPAEFLVEMARKAPLAKGVHGAMMAGIACCVLGFVALTRRLGLHRPGAAGGLIAYAIGGVAFIGAGTVNGFVVPDLVARAGSDLAESFDRLRSVLALCQVANRALAHIGVVSISAATALWSVDLLVRAERRRIFACWGLVASMGTIALLTIGRMPMNVHGFGLFVVIHGVWTISVGVQMVRGTL